MKIVVGSDHAGFLLKQRLAHVRRELSDARAARVNNTHGRPPS